jgi:hypothetical protein
MTSLKLADLTSIWAVGQVFSTRPRVCIGDTVEVSSRTARPDARQRSTSSIRR